MEFEKYLKPIERAAALLTHVVAVVSIVLGFWYYLKGQNAEQKRIAIEAITQIRSRESIAALYRLQDAYKSDRLSGPSVSNDMDFIVSWYDHIGMLYLNELADQCVIKKAVFRSTENVAEILNKMDYQGEARWNFDLFFLKMKENTECKL